MVHSTTECLLTKIFIWHFTFFYKILESFFDFLAVNNDVIHDYFCKIEVLIQFDQSLFSIQILIKCVIFIVIIVIRIIFVLITEDFHKYL